MSFSDRSNRTADSRMADPCPTRCAKRRGDRIGFAPGAAGAAAPACLVNIEMTVL
jgi:hypothetical protein